MKFLDKMDLHCLENIFWNLKGISLKLQSITMKDYYNLLRKFDFL